MASDTARTPDSPEDLAAAWLAAVDTPAVATELERVYAMAAEQIARRGPACWASGRCCNFRETGHLLYVTGLEAAYCVRRLASAGRGRLSSGAVEAARAAGGCPFQVGNLCGVHAIKPLGCRVYFCDRSAQGWQHDLTERGLGMLRELHERHGIPYRYGEWRGMLGMFAEAGADGPADGGGSEADPAVAVRLPTLPAGDTHPRPGAADAR